MPGRNSSSKWNRSVIDPGKSQKVRGVLPKRTFLIFLFDLYTQVSYKAPVRRGKAPAAIKPKNEKVQDNDEI